MQLSSGIGGPVECEYAVYGVFKALKREFEDIEFVTGHSSGRNRDCYSSIIFTAEHDISSLQGTIQWICTSPFRPHHKRKNWFISASIIPEDAVQQESGGNNGNALISRNNNRIGQEQIEGHIRIEKFHCGGHGGQNVNKVETGIRIIHDSGIVVTATSQRSQFANKQEALKRLAAVLREQETERQGTARNSAWREHSHLVRGNPVRIYRGMDFALNEEA